jgi:putative transposase
MTACQELSHDVGSVAACRAMGVARATYYRWLEPDPEEPAASRPMPPRALTVGERTEVLGRLHEERFVDRAPAEVFASLLDEGTYLCSIRTMYRILGDAKEVQERRNQLRHPHYQAPELLATAPNQVWSWDITKLLGPVKWTYFHLFVILDIFSRYVVGWMVADRESAVLAERLIAATCREERIQPDQLTIHADRGSSMKSKPVALLLADLGVTKTHSRPHVSDDNPYSESQFKTLKYCPGFPDRFGSIEDARAFCRDFFTWYNQEHRHGGIGLMTPAMVHQGVAGTVWDARKEVLRTAFTRNPERFVKGIPSPPELPTAAWINKPKTETNGTDAGVGPEEVLIPGVVGYRSEGDRQSWVNLEGGLLDPDPRANENYTKFELQVSQSH